MLLCCWRKCRSEADLWMTFIKIFAIFEKYTQRYCHSRVLGVDSSNGCHHQTSIIIMVRVLLSWFMALILLLPFLFINIKANIIASFFFLTFSMFELSLYLFELGAHQHQQDICTLIHWNSRQIHKSMELQLVYSAPQYLNNNTITFFWNIAQFFYDRSNWISMCHN